MAERRTKRAPAPAGAPVPPRSGSLPNDWSPSVPDAGGRSRAGDLVRATEPQWVGAIEAVVAGGFGLVISGTSDGGAIRIALLDDGDTTKKYAGDTETLANLLRDLRLFCSEHRDAKQDGPTRA